VKGRRGSRRGPTKRGAARARGRPCRRAGPSRRDVKIERRPTVRHHGRINRPGSFRLVRVIPRQRLAGRPRRRRAKIFRRDEHPPRAGGLFPEDAVVNAFGRRRQLGLRRALPEFAPQLQVIPRPGRKNGVARRNVTERRSVASWKPALREGGIHRPRGAILVDVRPEVSSSESVSAKPTSHPSKPTTRANKNLHLLAAVTYACLPLVLVLVPAHWRG